MLLSSKLEANDSFIFFPQNDIQPEFQVCVLRSDLTSQPWAENLSLSWPEPTEDAGEHTYFIDLRLAASLLTSLPYQAEAFLGMGILNSSTNSSPNCFSGYLFLLLPI